MAERKPLFMSTEGWSEEMATTDSMTLGGLTMSGGGIAMGSQKITGLADGTDPADGVNKSQLDQAIISGGTVKEVVLAAGQLDNTDGIYAAMMTYFANNPSTGNTVTITDGTTTRTYGAGTGGDVQFTIGATPWDTMQNFATAVNGDGSASWTAEATQEFDEINSNGVVLIIEDATGAGLSTLRMYGTFGTQADLQVVEYSDGTTADLDYANNTSSTASTTDPAGGRAGFQRQQSALVDGEIHYTRLTDVTYAWDDSDNVWQQFSGSGAIPDATAASGGGIKGKITVDSDLGLQVLSGVLGIDLAASTPGLSFDGSGDLQVDADTTAGIEITATGVAVDLAAAGAGTGGLEFDGSGDLQVKASGSEGIVLTATGVAIEIDDTPDTLDVDASGLKVVGLPQDFKINDVATNYDDAGTGQVSSANLNTLTAGSTSNADSLHTHSGLSVNEAERIENDINVDAAVAVGDPVYWTSTGDRVSPADAATVATTRPIGVALTAQSTVGDPTNVVSIGKAAGVLSTATPGARYYLAAGGGLTATRPVGTGNRIIQMGFAQNADDLWVEIQDFGRAA